MTETRPLTSAIVLTIIQEAGRPLAAPEIQRTLAVCHEAVAIPDWPGNRHLDAARALREVLDGLVSAGDVLVDDARWSAAP